jgi:general stress protein YciG
MSREEAGRKGGEKVAEEKGPEFYKEIGHKGGEAIKEEGVPEYFKEIGKRRREIPRREINRRINGREKGVGMGPRPLVGKRFGCGTTRCPEACRACVVLRLSDPYLHSGG